MSKLRLEGVKITLPKEKTISEAQIVEWLEYRLGINWSMECNNPLEDIDLSDCEIKIQKCFVDDKEIKI